MLQVRHGQDAARMARCRSEGNLESVGHVSEHSSIRRTLCTVARLQSWPLVGRPLEMAKLAMPLLPPSRACPASSPN